MEPIGGKDLSPLRPEDVIDCVENPELPLFESAAEPSSFKSAQEVGSLEPHPWIRYGARYIDSFLYSFCFGFVLGILDKAFSYQVQMNPLVLTALAVTSGTLLLEPYFLSSLGTTPGKWLFQVRIRNVNGSHLSFDQAIQRSLRVVVRGLGLGVPMIAIPLMIYQYRRLKSKGRTSWDEHLNVLSSHRKIGEARTFSALALIGLVLALSYL